MPPDPDTDASDLPFAIPVIEEQAEIRAVSRETGVVRVRVESDQIDHTVALARVEHNYVAHRVPRNLAVTEVRAPWTEGDVLVVPVYEEIEVIERRLMLKEEIRLTPQALRATSEVDVPLRKERVVVERQAVDGTWHRVVDARDT